MNVLAIGAHPDDIEYGCGGALTLYAQRGHDVYLFVASDGSLGGDAAMREREQDESTLVIGAQRVFWGGYRDTEVPYNRELIVRLEAVIRDTRPSMIFVNYPDDTHQDHRNLARRSPASSAAAASPRAPRSRGSSVRSPSVSAPRTRRRSRPEV